MTNLYNGYTESESMTAQRAFSRQMEAQGYKIQRPTSTLLNTEQEVEAIAAYIMFAELIDKCDVAMHPVDAAQSIEQAIDATLHAEDYDSTPTPSDMPVINFDDVQEEEY